ncbi:MAG TPA: hypothetical protein VEZ90_12835 [Blastocatellia bacterium]|nr:hypothetical protein [Blastocatellia bacterium]
MKKVEQLVEQMLTSAENLDDGLLANSLLSEFHRGAPLAYLRPLLLSPDHRVAALGAWIASELGQKGKPLLDAVSPLLSHPNRRVRFWIIDCVLLWAGPSDGREISQAACLIDDPEKAVRWKAMIFLYRASTDQLEAALAFLESEDSRSPNAVALRWLLSVPACDTETIARELRGPDARLRKYAAVAAARLGSQNKQPLAAAALSDDPEVAEFAADRLAPTNGR